MHACRRWHEPDTPDRLRPRDWIVLDALLVTAIGCAALVVLGSLGFETTRTWDNRAGTGQTWREGAARWAGWSFLCGVGALGALGGGPVAPRQWRAPFAATAAGAFSWAVYRAGMHWRRLLDERAEPRDYDLDIAIGLPMVTTFGAIGALLALVLVVA